MPAQNIGEVATMISGQFGAITDLMSAFAYLAGVGMGLNGAIKFKMHAEDPRQVPLSAPITLWVVSMSLLALPSFLDVGISTVMGPMETRSIGEVNHWGSAEPELPRVPVEVVPLEEEITTIDSTMDLGGSSGGW